MISKVIIAAVLLALLGGCGTGGEGSDDVWTKPPINPTTADKVTKGDRATLNGTVCDVASTVPADGGWYVAVPGADWGTGPGWQPVVGFKGSTLSNGRQGEMLMFGEPTFDRGNESLRSNVVKTVPGTGQFSAPISRNSDPTRGRILVCRGF